MDTKNIMEDIIDNEGSEESPVIRRYGSDECSHLQTIPTGFDSRSNTSDLSCYIKEEDDTDGTASNFSDHLRSYNEIPSFIGSQLRPTRTTTRESVGGVTCHNCLLL